LAKLSASSDLLFTTTSYSTQTSAAAPTNPRLQTLFATFHERTCRSWALHKISETHGTCFSTSLPIKHNWIHQQQMECQYSARSMQKGLKMGILFLVYQVTCMAANIWLCTKGCFVHMSKTGPAPHLITRKQPKMCKAKSSSDSEVACTPFLC
jgi:hypothetical protein